MSRPQKAFWLLVAATALTFGLLGMASGQLRDLHAAGKPLLDLRIAGYGYEEVRSYLETLGPEGRLYYLNVVWRLDSIFPALLALSLWFALPWLYPGAEPWGRSVLILIAFAGACFDYLENYHEAGMMVLGPELLTEGKVAAASLATRLKWLFDGIALLAVLLGLLRLALRRLLRWSAA